MGPDELKRKISEEELSKGEMRYELAWQIIKVLRDLNGAAHYRKIMERVEESSPFDFSKVRDRRSPKTGQNIFESRFRFVGNSLKLANLVSLKSDRKTGIWTLTTEGYSVDSEAGTIELCREADKEQSRIWMESKRGKARELSERTRSGEPIRDSGLVIEEQEERDIEGIDLESRWRERAIGILRDMSLEDFERFCGRMLAESGFAAARTQPSGDEAIDIVGGLRIISMKVGVQCESYTDDPVNLDRVKEFWASLDCRGAKKGIFITASGFTKEARKYADEKNIDLFDGDRLCERMEELELGLKKVYEVDEDFFSEFCEPKKD